MKLLTHALLLGVVSVGALYCGWVGLALLHRVEPRVAAGPPPELPRELEVSFERLARVPSFDEAAFRPPSALARASSSLRIELLGPQPPDGVEIAVLDGGSRGELARAPARGSIRLESIPPGDHSVVLVRRGASARREYLQRTTVSIAPDTPASCALRTELGSLTIMLGAGAAPPIVALRRPDDPAWHAEAHAQSTERSDGTLQVSFAELGDRPYLVVVDGLAPSAGPLPIAVAGATELGIRR